MIRIRLRWLSVLIFLGALTLDAAESPTELKKESPVDFLSGAIKDSGWNDLVVKGLSDGIVHSGSRVSSVFFHDDMYYCAFGITLPEVIKEPIRSSTVKKAAINKLLMLPALETKEIDSVLNRYAYQNLLMDYARGRLVKRVSAELEETGEGAQYADQGLLSVCLLSIPKGDIKLKTIEITSEENLLVYYYVALFKEAKELRQRDEFAQSAQVLLEARRQGYDGVALYRELYLCFLLSGNSREAIRARNLLTERFLKHLDFNDCLQFAEAAEGSPLPQESKVWYRLAEQSVRERLTLDMLMHTP